jgi:hypothetical protein
MGIKNITTKAVVIVFTFIVSVVVSACANTTITQSWAQQDAERRTYKQPMVLVISDSQQTRRIYEDSLVAKLKEEGVTATPSYLLIDGRNEINRETVDSIVQRSNQNAYNNMPIDSVLISYLAVVDKALSKQDSPLGETYSGDAEDNMLSATLIVGRGRFNTKEVIPLKNDLYDVQQKLIVWSVQTKTDDLTTIDALVLSVTETLVDELMDDEVLK